MARRPIAGWTSGRLGVILFEMLTGRTAFPGNTLSDTLAGVLKTEIDWALLPPGLHPEVRRLLERCLRKNADRRLHDIADARVVLADAVAGRLPEPTTLDAGVAAAPSRWRRSLWMATAVLAGAGLTAIVGWLAWPPPSAPPLRKMELVVGEQLAFPVYSPTGHLLYSRYTTSPGLWALPFSLETLEATGEPFLIDAGGRFASVSQDGTLIFMSRGENPDGRLVWIDRSGQVQGELTKLGRSRAGALSPDGKRLVYQWYDEQWDLWILDLERQTRTRLTFDEESNFWPDWSPDGREIVYATTTNGAEPRMFVIAADGRGTARPLGQGNTPRYTPDGNGIVYDKNDPDSDIDVWLLAPLDGEPAPLIQDKENQFFGDVSPAGSYLAYTSMETGRQEVFLTGFPEPTGKWQVSVGGGTPLEWSADGSHLYYLRREGEGQALMEVAVSTEPALTLGQPKQLFVWPRDGMWNYVVAPDGERFIATQAEGGREGPVLVVVQNWFEEFREPR